MEHRDTRSYSCENLEHLYNHMQICEALAMEGSRMAKILFRGKVHHLIKTHRITPSDEVGLILLTSLNRSLYDYFLLQFNLSFAECCYDNRTHIHLIQNIESLLVAGEKIIDAYSHCLDSSRSNESLIEQICAYIRAHLNGDLSLNAVSTEMFISKSHLCHIFKLHTNSTFCEYVRQQRIQRAQSLLISTSQSIDEIADACGFHSSTYFATVFKSEIGLSPSAFRCELTPSNSACGSAGCVE